MLHLHPRSAQGLRLPALRFQAAAGLAALPAQGLEAPLQLRHLRRRRHLRLVAAASMDAGAGQPLPQPLPAAGGAAPAKKKSSSLAKRAVFGTILGLGAAVVVTWGGWLYALVTCLVAFQASQELTGLVTAKGIAEGMQPPPPVISSLTSLLCVLLNAWVFVSGGRSASAMAVATFVVLSLQLLASDKPRFSQLASSVFGMLYCGERMGAAGRGCGSEGGAVSAVPGAWHPPGPCPISCA